LNVKEYISSGIIESYVLGLLSESECREFEAVSQQYPEVAAARLAFEANLEAQMLADAPPPPPQLKAAVLEKLRSTAEGAGDAQVEQAPVRHMNPWKWIAAASILLLAASLYWAFDANRKNEALAAENRSLGDSLSRAVEIAKAAGSAGTNTPKSDFKMASIHEGAASATIYWDTTSKDVYLMLNNMPQPASDRQYQLWALMPEEGAAPVDLGTIELRQERLLYRMKNVREAKAFAITLEPKGGSPSPTTAPMVSSQPSDL